MNKERFFLFSSLLIQIPALLLVPLLQASNDDVVQIQAYKISHPPKLDGLLKEKVWKEAIPFSNFRMINPYEGSQPSEKIELRILYNSQFMFIGVECGDRHPDKITVNSLKHDFSPNRNDTIKILIDPFQDQRTAYVFMTNAHGARRDGIAVGNHLRTNWDGLWEVKSQVTHRGWSTEIKIPFKTISFNPSMKIWRINVERYIPRKDETDRLSGISRDSLFTNSADAALLKGIHDIHQGKGVTIRPFSILSQTGEQNSGMEHSWTTDLGFDIYKHFAPHLVGVFSLNTDFAETEVDERRINLTRFPLFFPEKRTFFLEGSEIMAFGPRSAHFKPFFSRRIGLYEGEQVPVHFGLKFYGRVKDTNLALLDVRTRSFQNLPAQNFFVGRVSQNIFAQSKVGMIFTSGKPSSNPQFNRLLGFDFVYSTSRFRENKNLSVGGWWVYNWNPKNARHYGYGLKIDYPNDLWLINLKFNEFGEALDPGLGFLPRKSSRFFEAFLSYRPRPKKGLLDQLVRQFFFKFEPRFWWNLEGELETSRLYMEIFNARLESTDSIKFDLISTQENLPVDFSVTPNVIIPAGKYRFSRKQIIFISAPFRSINLRTTYNFGEFYNGHLDRLSLSTSYSFKGYIDFELSLNLVKGFLPQGNFKKHVFQVKTDIFIAPNRGLMSYIQYDNESQTLGLNFRFKWQIKPGNNIYLIYRRGWERHWNPTSHFFPIWDRGILKLQLSIRL